MDKELICSDCGKEMNEAEYLKHDCGEDVDAYGNTESDFRECSFPDCGCYGARNCMAPSGANYASNTLNIEKGRKPIHYEDLGT